MFGEKGHIRVPTGFAQLDTYRRGEIVPVAIFVTDYLNNNQTEMINVPGEHQWKLEVEYFAQAIQNGAELAFPAETGVSNMEVIDAIYASAKEASPISLCTDLHREWAPCDWRADLQSPWGWRRR